MGKRTNQMITCSRQPFIVPFWEGTMIADIFRRPDRLLKYAFTLIAAFALVCTSSIPASSFELIIGAGPSGSFSRHTSKLLCRIFAKHDPDITCSISESSDPIDNLTNVLGGSLDLALVDSLLLEEATNGKGAFQYLDINYDRIRIVTPLYEVPLTLIVRNDAAVSTIDQIPGKRINTGSFGSPEKHLFELFMQTQGWTETLFPVFAELSSSLSQDKLAFRQGDIQILVRQGVHPDSDLEQLLEDTGDSLIGFSGSGMIDLINSNPALSKQDIEKSTYPSLPDNLSTFGTTMTLISSADADDETIQSLINALETNKQSLQKMHPALSSFEIDKRPQWFGSIKVHSAILE
jgi:TRAP transporter TAXI family solute receptor